MDKGLTGTSRARPGLNQAMAAVHKGDTPLSNARIVNLHAGWHDMAVTTSVPNGRRTTSPNGRRTTSAKNARMFIRFVDCLASGKPHHPGIPALNRYVETLEKATERAANSDRCSKRVKR